MTYYGSGSGIRCGEWFTLIIGLIHNYTPNKLKRIKIACELWKTGLLTHHEYGGIRNNLKKGCRSDEHFRTETRRIRESKFDEPENSSLVEELKVIEALIPILARRKNNGFKKIVSDQWGGPLPDKWFPRDRYYPPKTNGTSIKNERRINNNGTIN